MTTAATGNNAAAETAAAAPKISMPPSTSPAATWLQLAGSEITRLNLSPDLLDVLRSFGGDDAPGPPNLDPDAPIVLASSSSDPIDLPTLISTSLSTEVDPDQAQMFARRFVSVSALLVDQGTPTSELLRLGLYRRAAQILAVRQRSEETVEEGEGAPRMGRALRIRALVDFVWSQALVLQLRQGLDPADGPRSDLRADPPLPTLDQLIDSSLQRSGGDEDEGGFAPGMHHSTIAGMTSDGGPVHINVLRVAKGAATIRTVDARTELTSDGKPVESLEQLADLSGAHAAVSGGFFLYSEPDIEEPSRRTDPVGLMVTDGKVVGPPVFRRAAVLQDGTTGEFSIERVGMDGVEVSIAVGNMESIGEGKSFKVKVGANGVRCVHRGDSRKVSLGRDEYGISIVGTRVFQVDKITSQGSVRMMDVPLAGFVLVVSIAIVNDEGANEEERPHEDIQYIEQGGHVSYRLHERWGGPNVRAAMAGGPILLNDRSTSTASTIDGDDIDNAPALDLPAEDFCGSAPPVTFSQDETFDRNLLPRMGAGLTPEGDLIFAAIDGRNLDQALGLTLRGTANLLKRLGCVRALNLDGGSSKRMVIQGKGVVDLHTTEIKASNPGKVASEVTKAENEEECKKTEPSPELSRPVHSAILFLPRK